MGGAAPAVFFVDGKKKCAVSGVSWCTICYTHILWLLSAWFFRDFWLCLFSCAGRASSLELPGILLCGRFPDVFGLSQFACSFVVRCGLSSSGTRSLGGGCVEFVAFRGVVRCCARARRPASTASVGSLFRFRKALRRVWYGWASASRRLREGRGVGAGEVPLFCVFVLLCTGNNRGVVPDDVIHRHTKNRWRVFHVDSFGGVC